MANSGLYLNRKIYELGNLPRNFCITEYLIKNLSRGIFVTNFVLKTLKIKKKIIKKKSP